MATWPETLPQSPLVDGFSSTKADGRLRSSMDAGPDKVRRRFTAVPKILTCSFYMTAAQRTSFWTFFDDTLIEGSLKYDWAHPITKVVSECRIKDVPEEIKIGYGWRISFTVEVLP